PLLLCPPPPRTSTLSLHDALPISCDSLRRCQFRGFATTPPRLTTLVTVPQQHRPRERFHHRPVMPRQLAPPLVIQPQRELAPRRDRKSTRLNSSHVKISYAVFCLK